MMENRGLSQELIIKLYMENVERFISIAFRYLGDREKARDIVSECYEYIIKRKESLTGGMAEIKTYLFLMVKSKCLDEIRIDTARKENLKNLYEADLGRLSDDNVSRKMIEWDIRKVLEKAGMKMSKRTFDIYVSSRFGGLSHKELAKLYGVAQSRVAKDISKANKIVQMVVKEYLHIIILIPYICILAIGGGIC